MTVELEVDCDICTSKHRYPLDPSGYYMGVYACNDELKLELQVEPTAWRQMIELKCSETIH